MEPTNAQSRPLLVATALSLCVGVAAVIAVLEWSRRDGAATPAATVPSRPSSAIATVQVVDAVRALKLVTWELETTVDAHSISDKWYGDAVAQVRAPVRYQYGVDLETMRQEDVLLSGPTVYTCIVPPPRRIAVEVDLTRLEESLRTSGLRWRSSNQAELEAARRALATRAADVQLSPDDAAKLKEVSREQLTRLIAGILGEGSRVEIRFAD